MKRTILLILCTALAFPVFSQKFQSAVGFTSINNYTFDAGFIIAKIIGTGILITGSVVKGTNGIEEEVAWDYDRDEILSTGEYNFYAGPYLGFAIKQRVFIAGELLIGHKTLFMNARTDRPNFGTYKGEYYKTNKLNNHNYGGIRINYFFEDEKYFRTIGIGFSECYGARIMLGIAL